MEMTLEQEFEEIKAVHKYAVLKAKLLQYYTDLQNTGITIPSFLQPKTPEQSADEYISELMLKGDNFKLFNTKYELAWQEIAPFLD